ncbi:hypothetical protein VNO77_37365 [Canavalia gladiata]|uniref:Uncharacterized protein n=1 Tax=Canavalia gladiata TaxID=3824 RepID=A0AAN9KBD9_CANGL
MRNSGVWLWTPHRIGELRLKVYSRLRENSSVKLCYSGRDFLDLRMETFFFKFKLGCFAWLDLVAFTAKEVIMEDSEDLWDPSLSPRNRRIFFLSLRKPQMPK